MKREARLLRTKAIDSLVLSVEHFNRPFDRGRQDAVLILLDHSFEMLLKSAILHRGAKIRKPGENQTLGFDECVRKALSDGDIQFLKQEEALLLQTINGLRDAAQHHLVEMAEALLYLHTQAGLTLFRDVFKRVFNEDLMMELPARVLPLSTSPPLDLASLFDNEVREIERLLKPGTRRGLEAATRLRALAILESAVQGQKLQPGDAQLRKLGRAVNRGQAWDQVFPGVASINMTATGVGPSIDLRITKREGVPIQLVPEGTPGASVVAIKRVNELDFYNLGRDQLAAKLGVSGPKATAAVEYLGLKDDEECFKNISIGKTQFGRYSQKAIERIKEALNSQPIEAIWVAYRNGERAG